jgi:flagellar biosynthesis anti-sigma factor FlgM
MRIDPSSQYLGNLAAEGAGQTAGQPKVSAQPTGSGADVAPGSPDAGDTVQFSPTASEAQRLAAQLSQTPAVRADRVTALQQQLQQGTYRPSNEQIASAMMSDLFGSSKE